MVLLFFLMLFVVFVGFVLGDDLVEFFCILVLFGGNGYGNVWIYFIVWILSVCVEWYVVYKGCGIKDVFFFVD